MPLGTVRAHRQHPHHRPLYGLLLREAPRTEQVDVDVELELCGLCSAYVEDRDKHVTWHERLTDTMTNLVISISALERQNHKD